MPKDNQSELFYWVDENDNVLGSIDRKTAHDGTRKIHRSVEIIVFNNNNEILLQKRSLKKDMRPGEWTISASGHVDFGESYEDAAKRELLEEISLDETLEFVTTIFHETKEQREMMAIFKAITPATEITFDKDEIEAVKWVAVNELNTFVTTHAVTHAGKIALKSLALI